MKYEQVPLKTDRVWRYFSDITQSYKKLKSDYEVKGKDKVTTMCAIFTLKIVGIFTSFTTIKL